MKTTMTLLLAALMGLVFAATSVAGIAGTAHDLSVRTGATPATTLSDGIQGLGLTEICVYCHTPHQANTVSGDLNPLWNMEFLTSATYTSYSSATFEGNVNADLLIGPSRVCMTCHDGTIAVDNALEGTSYIKTGKLIGENTAGVIDMGGDHPIGFTYDNTLAGTDGELQLTDAAGLLGGDTIATHLFSGVMTCATCHDVHDDTHGSFLLEVNDSSGLCLSCHIK